jgi:hypothetical protein
MERLFYSVRRLGSAMVQTVSRRLPTAAARVPSQVKSCEICGGQRGSGACFHRVLSFTAILDTDSVVKWENKELED